MTHPIYAIGDIHGQLEELHRVLNLIEADGGPDAQVVFVGDYVDRGPDSKGVLQFLIDAQTAGRDWTMIKGNHDRYLSRFLDYMIVHDPATRPDLLWFNPRLGGDKTMASYGVAAEDGAPVDVIQAAAVEAVPQVHRDFLQNLPLMHQVGELLFVHAGIRPKVPLDKQIEDDLVWIRQTFLEYRKSHGPLVVHGHTALEHPEHAGNRVNLDGGAGYFRPLHAAVFEGRDCWLLSDAGRVPLRP
ncbi:metallophosphoesterase family protein [uncultured Roseobacter sp.]|uniref:metallophosphoesterase family protein n=1 Tax=uncultured Roseobacter sp. TaxID=114847 RepID=UPI00260C807C|nr:metallophosphoesterase family protein [uncultured Roseobacter sp.]